MSNVEISRSSQERVLQVATVEPPLEPRLERRSIAKPKRWTTAGLLIVMLFYLALAVGRARTDSPGCDEGWFASPAYNLAFNGHMGTTVIEESNLSMTSGIHRYTYWIMPLNVLIQAGWYKLFGFGLFTMRSISLVFGLIALFAWFSIVNSMTGDSRLALLTTALIACDFVFIRGAANGRMDMMCAALNFAALAVYVKLRERNLSRAIFLSQCLVVASGLTHPNGLLGLVGVGVFVVAFDRRRISFRHILIGLVPYLVGAAAFAPHALNDPHLLVAQLSGNGAGRLWGLRNPLGALNSEINERYIGSGGAATLKLALLAIYAASVAGALLIRRIRSHRGYQALLVLSAIIFVYFTLMEGTKLYLYLIQLSPILTALLAAVIASLWQRRVLRRWLVPAMAAVVLLNLAGTAYVIKRNSLNRNFLPAVRFLNENMDSSARIIGTAELTFGLKRYDSLLDDKWLGYNTGATPDLIVLDPRYQQEQQAVGTRDPQIHDYIVTLLSGGYRQVYDDGGFQIYSRR